MHPITYSLRAVQLLTLKRCMLYVLDTVCQQDSDGDSGNNTSRSNKKPMKYKDVVRAQVLAADTAEDAISSDEEGGANRYANGWAILRSIAQSVAHIARINGDALLSEHCACAITVPVNSSRHLWSLLLTSNIQRDTAQHNRVKGGESLSSTTLAYDEEQKKLRQSLLQSIDAHDANKSTSSSSSTKAKKGKKAANSDTKSKAAADSDDSSDDDVLQVRKKTADEVASEEAQFKKELAELDLKEDHGEEGDSFLKDFIVNKVLFRNYLKFL
eukprot:13087-Heterococcus_DN1.PRE.3